MRSLFKQENSQFMIITNHEMRLYVWENKSFHFVSEFDGSSHSLEAFKQVQGKLKKLPAILITNILEESFRSETIAPVSGSDRKALMDRKLNYAFRKTSFRTASVIEREKDGRRDNRILLSGLTKPDLLLPWLKILLENKTPVQSVSSAAYLAEAFAKTAGFDKESYTLVTSLERNNELRQTFMKKGKILFSRLTTLSSRNLDSLGKEIYKESVQIRSYLERVKLLPYEEYLKIKIYCSHDDDELKLIQKTTHLNHFDFINIHHELAKYSTALTEAQQGPLIYFLHSLLQKKLIHNTYASPKIRKYFLLANVGRSLVYASFGIIVLSLALSIPMYLESWDLSKQQSELITQTQPLEIEYGLLTQRFPETPIPSKEMALVVESYEQILAQVSSPIAAMSYISENIASSPTLQLTEITWTLLPNAADPASPEYANMRYLSYPINSDDGFIAAVLDNRTSLRVEISGIAYSSGSYREAQQQVQLFADALAARPGVRVTPVRMPTNVRVDTPVNTTIDNNELSAPFLLQLDIESL